MQSPDCHRSVQDGREAVQDDGSDILRVPVLEEDLTVGIREKVTGRVRVHTRAEDESLVLKRDLSRSRVVVERMPVGQPVDRVPEERMEGDVRIIPVFEERLVVTRELWLVEELHIRRETIVEAVDVPVTRRVTRVDIDRDTGPQQED